MARPTKDGVDYFPHDIDATSKRTLFTLESMFGNDGYAFWFKLLEILGSKSTLSMCVEKAEDWLFLVSKMKVSERRATEILNLLARLGAIDAELWENKIIWVQNFASRLDEVFRKRGTQAPGRPLNGKEAGTDGNLHPENGKAHGNSPDKNVPIYTSDTSNGKGEDNGVNKNVPIDTTNGKDDAKSIDTNVPTSPENGNKMGTDDTILPKNGKDMGKDVPIHENVSETETPITGTETPVSDAVSTQSKVKESKVNNNIYICAEQAHAQGNAPSHFPPEIEPDALFKKLWAQYPRKLGKGKIGPAARRRIAEIGQEHMLRCIMRFKADMEAQKREIDKYPYGSTFFNSGYVDYMDGNYEKIDYSKGCRHGPTVHHNGQADGEGRAERPKYGRVLT